MSEIHRTTVEFLAELTDAGTVNDSEEEVMVDVLFEQYQERLVRLQRHWRTIRNYERAIFLFSAWLAANRLDARTVQSDDVELFLAALPAALSVKRLYLMEIGAAYRYGLRRGLVKRDPTVDVEIATVPDEEPRIIPLSDMREMKERAVTPEAQVMFGLLAYTGMRRNEVRTMTWEALRERHTLTIMGMHGKQGKLRHVPVHPALDEVLNHHRKDEGPMLPTRFGWQMSDTAFQYHYEKFAKEPWTPHDFRRTVASSLYRNGVATDTIDRILGWAPRTVRSRYYVRIADDQLQRAILKLYADDPI